MNKEVRWRFEARLMGRYRVAEYIGSQLIEEAWAEFKDGVLRLGVWKYEVWQRGGGISADLLDGVRRCRMQSGQRNWHTKGC